MARPGCQAPSLLPGTHSVLHLGCQPHPPRCHQLIFAEASAGKWKVQRTECSLSRQTRTQGACDRCWARSPQEAQLYKPRESVLGWYWARMCGHLLLPSPLPPPAAAASLRTGLFGKNPGSPGSPHSAVHVQRPRGCPSMRAPPCLSLVESVSPGLLRSTLSGNQWHFPLLCP